MNLKLKHFQKLIKTKIAKILNSTILKKNIKRNLALIHRNEVNEFFSKNDPEFNGEVINLSNETEDKSIFIN